MLGSIHSVTLKNFMVYNHIVFKPSPGLNLVIGSNGSGKSSILIAIIIGLGGQLEDIGRCAHYLAFSNEKLIEVKSLT